VPEAQAADIDRRSPPPEKRSTPALAVLTHAQPGHGGGGPPASTAVVHRAHVFGNVDNQLRHRPGEISAGAFGHPRADEDDAVRIANDTIYGPHASVFTNDVNGPARCAGCDPAPWGTTRCAPTSG